VPKPFPRQDRRRRQAIGARLGAVRQQRWELYDTDRYPSECHDLADVLSASFAKEGNGLPAEGALTLHFGDRLVGEGRIRTQPGKFGLGGGGLLVGRSGGEPVADGYPGQAPYPFVGGEVMRLAIDISGEPFADLAREAAALYARQ
jgi:hypothetical protein